eukprot:1634529-Rhodomonas_salina.1
MDKPVRVQDVSDIFVLLLAMLLSLMVMDVQKATFRLRTSVPDKWYTHVYLSPSMVLGFFSRRRHGYGVPKKTSMEHSSEYPAQSKALSFDPSFGILIFPKCFWFLNLSRVPGVGIPCPTAFHIGQRARAFERILFPPGYPGTR